MQNTVNCYRHSTVVEVGGDDYGLEPAPMGGWYVYADGEVTHHAEGPAAALAFRAAYGAAIAAQAQMAFHFAETDALAMARFRANHPVGSEWMVDALEYNAARDY